MKQNFYLAKLYLYEGSGNAWAGHNKAKEPPKFFSKVPKVFDSDENFGNAPPIGSDFLLKKWKKCMWFLSNAQQQGHPSQHSGRGKFKLVLGVDQKKEKNDTDANIEIVGFTNK